MLARCPNKHVLALLEVEGGHWLLLNGNVRRVALQKGVAEGLTRDGENRRCTPARVKDWRIGYRGR